MKDRPVAPGVLIHYGRFLLGGLLWTLSLWLYSLSMALLALQQSRSGFPWQVSVIWLPAVAGTFAAFDPGRRPRLQRLMLAVLLTTVVLTLAGLVSALAAVLLMPPQDGSFAGALWVALVQMGAAFLVRYACYPASRSWLLEVLLSLALVFLPDLVALPWLALPAGVGVWLVAAWGSAGAEA